MNRVYLGRLSNRAQDKDIERFFKGFGKITDIMLKSGFAFVEFENKRDVDDAVDELNGKVLCGERVIVEHAKGTPRGEDFRRDLQKGYPIPSNRYSNDRSGRGSPPGDRTYRLIVKNLSSKVSWQDLKDYMRKAGEVIYADAHKDRRNEGVVEFMSHREVQRAIDKLDGRDLCGRRIELIDDSTKGDRGDRKRSRSRSADSDGGSRARRGGRRASSAASCSRSRSHDRRRRARDDSASPPRRDRSRSQSASPRPSRKNKSSFGSASPPPTCKNKAKSRSTSPAPPVESKTKSRTGSPPGDKRKRKNSGRDESESSEKKRRSRSAARKSEGGSSGDD